MTTETQTIQTPLELEEMSKHQESEIIITDHAYERGKERIGLGKVALNRYALKAYQQGLTHGQTKGRLHKYITKIWYNNKKVDNIRIYGEHIYLFHQNILITVYHTPNHLRQLAKHLKQNKS